jgi:hypothetical protein
MLSQESPQNEVAIASPSNLVSVELDLDELIEMQEQAQSIVDFYTDLITSIEAIEPKTALQLTQQFS